MTIRELAAGNPMIMDINIDIRENGKLKHIYRFGCGAEYYNSDGKCATSTCGCQ